MRRVTIMYIASGQPRAYADSRTINRVLFEHTPPRWAPYSLKEVKADAVPWQPHYLDEQAAEISLRSVGGLGKVLWKKDIKHGLESHLVSITPIDPKKAKDAGITWGDPERMMSDVWEYYICQPYTD